MYLFESILGIAATLIIGLGLTLSREKRKRQKAEAVASTMNVIAEAAKQSEGRTKEALKQREKEVEQINAAHRVIVHEVREVAKAINNESIRPQKLANLWNELMDKKGGSDE